MKNDTSYITDLSQQLTVRAFVANKFARYSPGDYNYNKKLNYEANDNYNIGMGFNYKYLGLNMSMKMPFVNDDTARFGKTRFLDIQSFIYTRKIILDLYYLSYKGYYLSSRSLLSTDPIPNVYPLRPDLRTRNIGLNAQYIFNNRRFSFRAAFLQNEYQKKSSGSVIAGGGLHYIRVRADSAIIPNDIGYSSYFGKSSFTGSNILTMGANIGYAHTLVYKKHYFVTGALLAGTGINYSNTIDGVNNGKDSRLSMQLNTIVRLAAGYNSADYYAGIQYINFVNRNNAPIHATWQEFQTGNVRVTFAKRFKLKREIRRKIIKIENTIKSELGIDPPPPPPPPVKPSRKQK